MMIGSKKKKLEAAKQKLFRHKVKILCGFIVATTLILVLLLVMPSPSDSILPPKGDEPTDFKGETVLIGSGSIKDEIEGMHANDTFSAFETLGGYGYSISWVTGMLIKIDLNTGSASRIGTTDGNAFLKANGGTVPPKGEQWYDAKIRNGFMYAISADDGIVMKANIETGEMTKACTNSADNAIFGGGYWPTTEIYGDYIYSLENQSGKIVRCNYVENGNFERVGSGEFDDLVNDAWTGLSYSNSSGYTMSNRTGVLVKFDEYASEKSIVGTKKADDLIENPDNEFWISFLTYNGYGYAISQITGTIVWTKLSNGNMGILGSGGINGSHNLPDARWRNIAIWNKSLYSVSSSTGRLIKIA